MYRKNLTDITKTTFMPKATTLIPFGKGGLTIENVNDGRRSVEDFSWYKSLGYTLTEARRLFNKEHTFSDERFIYAGNLKREAERRLRTLSHPQISYGVTVAILDRKVNIGDYGFVDDAELGIKVKVKIVRLVEYEDINDNQIELNYLIPGLQNLQEERDGADGVSDESNMILVKNEDSVTVGDSYQLLLEMSITTFKSTNAQVGLLIVGESSAPGFIEGYFKVGQTQLSTELKHSYNSGWTTIGMPFVIPQLQDGSHLLQLYVKTSTDFKVDRNKAEMYVVAENLLGGMSSNLPRANIVDEVTYTELIGLADHVDVKLINPINPINLKLVDDVIYTTDFNVADRVSDVMVSVPREQFAKMSNYPHLETLEQDVVDDFVDNLHRLSKSFALFNVENAIKVLASNDYIYVDTVELYATSGSDMYLLGGDNSKTNIGKFYKPTLGLERLEIYNRR